MDNSPSKQLFSDHPSELGVVKYFSLACDSQPAEELYDLRKDHTQTNKVATHAEYGVVRRRLRAALDRQMRDQGSARDQQG